MTGQGPSTITQKELLPVAVARVFGGGGHAQLYDSDRKNLSSEAANRRRVCG